MLPGQRLRQDELAQQLGVSSTPVREALQRLEAEGILVHVPHKGVKVANIGMEGAQEIYRIRSVLESHAAELAVPNLSITDIKELEQLHKQMKELLDAANLRRLQGINEQFHMTLYEAARTHRLYPMIVSLWSQFPWDTLWVIPGRAQGSMDEHLAILGAIQSGAADLAGERMKQHIESAGRSVTEHIQRVDLTLEKSVRAIGKRH